MIVFSFFNLGIFIIFDFVNMLHSLNLFIRFKIFIIHESIRDISRFISAFTPNLLYIAIRIFEFRCCPYHWHSHSKKASRIFVNINPYYQFSFFIDSAKNPKICISKCYSPSYRKNEIYAFSSSIFPIRWRTALVSFQTWLL